MTHPAAPADAIELELRHRLLRAVDRAIGAEAEVARLDAEVAALAAELALREAALRTARTQTTRALAARDRLAAQLAAMRASRTWRVGQAIVRPASRLARQVRR